MAGKAYGPGKGKLEGKAVNTGMEHRHSKIAGIERRETT
jgi:hypothetical protein